MRTTTRLVATLALTMVVGGSGGLAAARAETTTPAESLDLTVAWQPGALISAPDWFADAQGFFTERGLNVDLQQTDNGPASLAAGLTGDVDIFYGPQANAVSASTQGECFQFLTSGQRSPINIIARTDVELPHAADPYPGALVDLEGLTIGVPVLGSATDNLTRLVMSSAGLEEGDVEYVASGVGATAVAALENDQVQVLAAFPPMEQILGEGNFQTVIELVGNPDSPLFEQITSHSVATCEFVEENTDAVVRYCQAWWDAREWALDPANLEAAGSIIAEYLGVEPDVGTAIWEQYGVTFDDPILTPELWEAQREFSPPELVDVEVPFEEWVFADCVSADPRG